MKKINHHLDVLLFDNEDKKQGAIIRKPGSRKLYVLFSYFDRRVEKTTGLNDTPANRKKVRLWLDRIIERRDVFWFSVNRTFSPFVINHHERRKVHAKETSQLQPRRESFHFTSSLGRADSHLRPV